jgi:hypothetical protein
MRLWIVGKPTANESSSQVAWEFQGVFNTRDQAVDACTGPNHFLFPATLNQRLPEETVSSPGTEFPNRTSAELPPRKKPR